ncbi:unnamed protein product [Callosobruchus maculatus]|uniref:Phospholipid/glycerol acyltransferase domain-containing protein n=1 Tax=Callosobruchus maculatus TaxID=64391 RepID=A0A653CEV3_CALMS|nr:unnamed protein product [Callosobruchus maculatus]
MTQTKTKFTGGISHEEYTPEVLLNPFVHRLELDTTYEKIKTYILTVILLPIRVSLICFFVITGWIFASIGLWGLTEEELRQKPLEGWRKVRVMGNPAPRKEAPVVALAPHSSFVDSIAMVIMGGPSIVAKAETARIPFFGKR